MERTQFGKALVEMDLGPESNRAGSLLAGGMLPARLDSEAARDALEALRLKREGLKDEGQRQRAQDTLRAMLKVIDEVLAETPSN